MNCYTIMLDNIDSDTLSEVAQCRVPYSDADARVKIDALYQRCVELYSADNCCVRIATLVV